MTDSPVYRPVPPEGSRHLDLSPRAGNFEGLTLGLVGNWKPNADVLLNEVGRLLGAYGIKEVILREKYSCSVPAPIPMLDEIAEKCDLALTAMGDCGSCTTWCINDAVELERRGIPALSFVATPFMVLAKYELESLGIDLAIGEVARYPFGGLDKPAVHEQAALVLPQVVEQLTSSPVPALAAEG